MFETATARPQDLAMMRRVLDDYCSDQRLRKTGLMREAGRNGS